MQFAAFTFRLTQQIAYDEYKTVTVTMKADSQAECEECRKTRNTETSEERRPPPIQEPDSSCGKRQ
jgi:hypothetical protein